MAVQSSLQGQLPHGYTLREMQGTDAPALALAYQRNREHLAPWEPIRPEAFYSRDGQTAAVEQRLADQREGRGASWVLVHDAEIVGRVDLSNIARGVFQSCSLGYWVDGSHTGRGLASAAVEQACAAAAGWGLHRVEAATVLSNLASQRVLGKCGFAPVGTATAYLFIAGRWQDHRILQRLLHDDPPS